MQRYKKKDYIIFFSINNKKVMFLAQKHPELIDQTLEAYRDPSKNLILRREIVCLAHSRIS